MRCGVLVRRTAAHTFWAVARLTFRRAHAQLSGGRSLSSGTGAIFIQAFVKKSIPWAHLDIAGTAFLSELKAYHPTAATGVGIRLLVDFLEHGDGG